MKKTALVIVSLLSILLFAVGCTTSKTFTKSYTYNVTTGDTIKVQLDRTGGYDISAESPFKISKDDDVLGQGAFITLAGVDQYLDLVEKDSDSKVIEKDSANGLEYTFYSYKDEEYNYVIKISGSNTGILLANDVSEESAKECFKRLTITKE